MKPDREEIENFLDLMVRYKFKFKFPVEKLTYLRLYNGILIYPTSKSVYICHDHRLYSKQNDIFVIKHDLLLLRNIITPAPNYNPRKLIYE
jgi:hypothetical protein